jgi:hypothetical protein
MSHLDPLDGLSAARAPPARGWSAGPPHDRCHAANDDCLRHPRRQGHRDYVRSSWVAWAMYGSADAARISSVTSTATIAASATM